MKLLSTQRNEKSLFFSNLSGVKDDVGSKSIDEMNPSTKEEFVELSQLIVGKLSNYEVMIVLCQVRPCLITPRKEFKTHFGSLFRIDDCVPLMVWDSWKMQLVAQV